MRVTLVENPSLTLAWIGLLGSGYGLFDESSVWVREFGSKCRRCLKNQKEILAYFGWAKSSKVAVNPYWPRASAISTAAFFLHEQGSEIDLQAYLGFEKEAGAHHEWQSSEFIEWLSKLPLMLKKLQALPETDELLQETQIVITENREQYEEAFFKANALFETFANGMPRETISFVPNPLQAPQLTDIVRKENEIIVIAAEPKPSCLLHESLHSYLHPLIGDMPSEEIKRAAESLNLIKLKGLGYLWDESETALRRAVEESAVRNLVLAISDPSLENKLAGLLDLKAEGFTVKPDLALYPSGYWNAGNLKHFLERLYA
ncbi:MAG: hypothetical protein VB108_01035 [Anaerolineaceae bacterium]|nr:hypothetical protein [Anaerolineaceae bacterium]